MAEKLVTREAKLFEAGSYPDKGVTVTEADLDTIIANHPADGVDIKIEHRDTPFNGFLGKAKSLYRKGIELFGVIEMPEPVFELAQKADARKLSVGLKRDLSGLSEVSITDRPRVATAGFNDDPEIVWFEESLGNQLDAVRRAVYTAYPDTSTGDYTYISDSDIYSDYLIMRRSTRMAPGQIYYKLSWAKDVNGVVALGVPSEVKKVVTWEPAQPVTPAFNADDNKSNRGDNVNEQEIAAMKAENEAIKAENARMAEQNKLMFNKIDELANARKKDQVDAQVKGWIAAGKIAPAVAEFATAILMNAGDQTITFGEEQINASAMFSRFIEASPAVVSTTEQGKQTEGSSTTFSKSMIDFAKELGVTPEDIEKYRGDK